MSRSFAKSYTSWQTLKVHASLLRPEHQTYAGWGRTEVRLSHRILPFVTIRSLLSFERMQSLPVLGSLNGRLGQIQMFGHIPERSIEIPFKRFHYTLVILITNTTSILTAFFLPFDAQSFVVTFNHTTYR